MIVGQYEKFCKKYYECEGYNKALNSNEEYFLHHIQGENNISVEELIENNLYYDCEPADLKWVTHSEHMTIHHKGKVLSDETKRKMSESGKVKVFTADHRKNLSEAMKGDKNPNKRIDVREKISEAMKGKSHSLETRKKMSESKKGRTAPNKGKSWKLVDGKRIYSVVKK